MTTDIDDLRETLYNARMYHQGWWYIVAKHEDRDFVVEGMSSHLVFFNAIASAFFDALVIKLASIFDENKKSISFVSNSEFSAHALFPKIRDKGEKLFKFRNKFVAHRDYSLVAKPEDFQSGLTHDDLGYLLNSCCQIFDDVAHRLGVAPIYDFSCEEDIMNLIEILTREQKLKP